MTGDRNLVAALDRYTVPPLSDGFAERVLARTQGRVPIVTPVLTRRDRRGGWARARTVLLSFSALSLISAGAAATGMFGDVAKNVPVLGTLIARVAPAPKRITPAPAKLAVAAKPAPVRLAPIVPAVADAPPIEIASPVLTFREERRDIRRNFRKEFIARRIVERMDERRAARRAAGLPPQSMPPRAFIQRWRMLPQEERFAIRQRVREIRQARRAERETGTPNLDAPVPSNTPY